MQGREDRAKFSVLLFWLADRMKSAGGLPADVDELLGDYFNALADIRIERLEWSARHLFATQRWFPMPIDLREAAMLAPSSVLPALPNNQPQICEFSEEQIADAKAKFAEIVDKGVSLSFTPAVVVPGCQRPVYSL